MSRCVYDLEPPPAEIDADAVPLTAISCITRSISATQPKSLDLFLIRFCFALSFIARLSYHKNALNFRRLRKLYPVRALSA